MDCTIKRKWKNITCTCIMIKINVRFNFWRLWLTSTGLFGESNIHSLLWLLKSIIINLIICPYVSWDQDCTWWTSHAWYITIEYFIDYLSFTNDPLLWHTECVASKLISSLARQSKKQLWLSRSATPPQIHTSQLAGTAELSESALSLVSLAV